MASITSVNIACGGHAGDEQAMAATIQQALRNKLAIGAHPGYADRANFGRIELNLSPHEVAASVYSQVHALAVVAARYHANITHVKPHGALYNQGHAALKRSTVSGNHGDYGSAVYAGGPLLPRHLADLRGSGLSDEQVRRCGFYSASDPAALPREFGIAASLFYGVQQVTTARVEMRLGTVQEYADSVEDPAVAMVVSFILLTAGAYGLALTSTEEFCIGCHEMRENVYAEYKGTIHDKNRSGVRATCPSCHVPHEPVALVLRKMKASFEVWGHLMGKIDTKEKFQKHRYEMAVKEWTRMKKNGSQECRNCHHFEAMEAEKQSEKARARHAKAASRHLAHCIDDVRQELDRAPQQEKVEDDFVARGDSSLS